MVGTETPDSSGLRQEVSAASASPASATAAAASAECQRLRSVLRGAEAAIFDLVCSRTTLEQWAEWLRAPLEHAVTAGSADLLAKLQGAGATATSVHSAVRGGQEAVVQELLRLGASPSEQDEDGDSPLHVAVCLGHGGILSLLLREGGAVDALDEEGRSALHLASEDGSLDLVQRLVSFGADLSLRYGDDCYSALDLATAHGCLDVMKFLIQHGVDVNDGVIAGPTYYTALHVGASSNQAGAIDVLVEAGADIDDHGGEEWETPLHIAAKVGHSEAVGALLRHGADVDMLDGDGCSAIFLATSSAATGLIFVKGKPDLCGGEAVSTPSVLPEQERFAEVVRALAQHGASVNAVTEGRTPLHVATSKNAVAIVDVLIAAGADINAQEGKRQETPLHIAARLGHSEAVGALLRHGADVDERNGDGCSALHIAAEDGSAAIVEALLAAGAKLNLRGGEHDSTALGLATRRGHVDVVDALIKHGASLNAADESGCTPLHVAASNNELPVTEMLLAAGARVDVRDEDGETPLHVAADGNWKNGHPAIIETLMRYGAGSIAFTVNGEAPIHLAAQRGHEDATTALLVAGADVNLRTKDGVPALLLAAEHTGVLNVLIEHGAEVTATDSKGRTALHLAAAGSDAGAIDALVAGGADLEVEDDDGVTPLLSASGKASLEVFSALLRHGANSAKRDAKGLGVIHKAADGGDVEVIKAVLANGADLNLREDKGRTALHLAGVFYPAVVETLIEHGADTEARDRDGCTALHTIAGYFMDEPSRSIDFLVSGGAAIEARDDRGRTPLHYAASKHNTSAMRALLRSGADLHARDNAGRSPLHQVIVSCGYDVRDVAEVVDLLLRWGADETATVEAPGDDSEDSEEEISGKTAWEMWEFHVEDYRVSAAGAAPVRKLLADAQKDRTWRRRGWLVLVRAFPERVRLKADFRCAAITGRARRVRARGPSAAASDGGAQAGSAPRCDGPARGLNGLVAGAVTFPEDGVFRNIVEFL